MYTLTRAAHVRPLAPIPAPKTHMETLMDERADRENFNMSQSTTDTDSCDDSQDESMIVFKVPAGPNNAEATLVVPRQTQLRKRQPKITGKLQPPNTLDFLLFIYVFKAKRSIYVHMYVHVCTVHVCVQLRLEY